MSRDYAETIRNYHRKGLEWITELGVDKVIHRANRILKQWGIGHSIVLLHIPEPAISFYPQRFPYFAFGVEGSNIPLAYIFPENSEVICDWGFLYTYNLPAVSKGLVHPTQADNPSPFLIPLPKALAIATTPFSFPIPPWWGGVQPNFENLRYMLVVFQFVSDRNPWASKISVVFKERTAHCSILKCQVGREDTVNYHEFEGKHKEVVREILKIAALMTI
jgi:malonyl CoA-acyl carrier protein transacylase